MNKHNDYEVKERLPDGVTVNTCGCIWRGHSCKMEDMCAEGKRVAGGIMKALSTPEEKARIATIYEKAKADGGCIVND